MEYTNPLALLRIIFLALNYLNECTSCGDEPAFDEILCLLNTCIIQLEQEQTKG